MPALLDHPKAWPAGEMERLLAKTVALDLLMGNYQGYNPFSPAGKRIASPWAPQPKQW